MLTRVTTPRPRLGDDAGPEGSRGLRSRLVLQAPPGQRLSHTRLPHFAFHIPAFRVVVGVVNVGRRRNPPAELEGVVTGVEPGVWEKYVCCRALSGCCLGAHTLLSECAGGGTRSWVGVLSRYRSSQRVNASSEGCVCSHSLTPTCPECSHLVSVLSGCSHIGVWVWRAAFWVWEAAF